MASVAGGALLLFLAAPSAAFAQNCEAEASMSDSTDAFMTESIPPPCEPTPPPPPPEDEEAEQTLVSTDGESGEAYPQYLYPTCDGGEIMSMSMSTDDREAVLDEYETSSNIAEIDCGEAGYVRCSTGWVRERGRNGAGGVLWKYRIDTERCWNGRRITKIFPYRSVYVAWWATAWSFKGHTTWACSSNCEAEKTQSPTNNSYIKIFAQGRFEGCLISQHTKICQNAYPWLKQEFYSDGRYYWDKGGGT